MVYFVDMATALSQQPALTPAAVLASLDALSPVPRVTRPLAPHQLMVYVSNGTIGYWHGWTGFDTYAACLEAEVAMRRAGMTVRGPSGLRLGGLS